MSDDLLKMIEAVEAGGDAAFRRCNRVMFATPAQEISLQLREDNSYLAYSGSVDAAIALCEALLPGWAATVDTSGFAHVYKDEFEVTHNTSALLSRQPARALLLAVLRAKLMEMEDEY